MGRVDLIAVNSNTSIIRENQQVAIMRELIHVIVAYRVDSGPVVNWVESLAATEAFTIFAVWLAVVSWTFTDRLRDGR